MNGFSLYLSISIQLVFANRKYFTLVMFQILAVIIYLISFSDCEIKIYVKPSSNKDYINVTYSGDDKKPITNTEVKLFNITDGNLSKGVRIELGKEPDEIFLNDPTKYGNLYERYKWMPVTRKLKVHKINILEVINENVVLKSHEYINNSTETIKYKASISETVENSITSDWNKEGLPEDDITYDVEYNFNGQVISYQNKWRKSNFHTPSVPFGMKKDGYINIKPGKKVTVRLKGKKLILLLEVRYIASLIGSVVVNYAHLYGKYHFWAPAVNDIMKAMGILNRIVTTELLEVRCYADPVVEIFDSCSGDSLQLTTLPTPFRVRHKN